MCLFRVRQEEDVVVPYRVARVRSPSPRRRSSHRVSRTEVIRESRPTVVTSSSSYIVPAPKPLSLPAPQPAPVFVEPAPVFVEPPAPPRSAAPSHHYVEVSPHSSTTSYSRSPSRSEYVVHEREVRRERHRDYSPEPARYESFRYVEPPPEERYERYVRRERSRSRDSRGRSYAYDDPRGSYRETRERIIISDGDGRRRREYHR